MSVTIDKNYCKGCNLCVAVCKPQALAQGKERNAKGYLVPEWNGEVCVSCGTCAITCPELAVTAEKEK